MPGLFDLLKNLLTWSDDSHKRISQKRKSHSFFNQRPFKRRQINMGSLESTFDIEFSDDEDIRILEEEDEKPSRVIYNPGRSQLPKRQILTPSRSRFRNPQKAPEKPCENKVYFNPSHTRQPVKILGTTFNHVSSWDRPSCYFNSHRSPLNLLAPGRFNETSVPVIEIDNEASTSKTKPYREMSVIEISSSDEEKENSTSTKSITDLIDEKYKARNELLSQEIEDQMKLTNMLAKSHQLKRDIALSENLKKSLRFYEPVIDEFLTLEPKLPVLTPEMVKQVNDAMNPVPTGEVLSSNFGLEIRRRDIQTLNKTNWLNDEVINFYMNLLIERGKLGGFPKVYAMNTFFYPKLVSTGYSSLKRWTRKIDIFSYDMVVVPIHLGMHWCMAIIDFREKTIKYFDSMGGDNQKCLLALKKYLEEESLDKKKQPFDTNDWKLECMKKIPHQKNGSDCGVFSCMFAEYASRRQPYTFSQDNMPYFRKKMTYEILKSKLL